MYMLLVLEYREQQKVKEQKVSNRRQTGRGQRGANEEAWPAHSGSPRLLGTSRLSMLPWQRGDALSALPIPHPGPQGRWQNGLAWALLPQCPALKRVGRGEVF